MYDIYEYDIYKSTYTGNENKKYNGAIVTSPSTMSECDKFDVVKPSFYFPKAEFMSKGSLAIQHSNSTLASSYMSGILKMIVRYYNFESNKLSSIKHLFIIAFLIHIFLLNT